jgi:hypothetical protein
MGNAAPRGAAFFVITFEKGKRDGFSVVDEQNPLYF